MTKMDSFKDLLHSGPPVFGQDPDKPVDPGEPPPRSQQMCANCDASVIMNGQLTCCANPPSPTFLGFQPSKTLDAHGQPRPMPIVPGFWPPTEPQLWCRAWAWIGPEGKS